MYKPKTYDKTSMPYYKLQLATNVLNSKRLIDKDNMPYKFSLETVYFDKGRDSELGLTIMAYKENGKPNSVNSYQFLYPNEQEELIEADCFADLLDSLEKIYNERGLMQDPNKKKRK